MMTAAIANESMLVIYLPGAGNGSPNLTVLRSGPNDGTCFETVYYPGWQRYVREGFSPEALIDELATEIAARVPRGPIHILGLSVGGHFGYAAALRLQAMGREIGGFCALDSFMIEDSAPGEGWQGRALAEALELLRNGRLIAFSEFLRSRFWRALLRLANNRLPQLIRTFSSASGRFSVTKLDPILEAEVSMRLLMREAAPWLGMLDQNPTRLNVPTVLIRTAHTAGDDDAWRRRCPRLEVREVTGRHHSLFEPENVGSLRNAFISATRQWT